MQKYRSHKVIEAAPILVAEFDEDGSGRVGVNGGKGLLEWIEVPAGFKRPNTEPKMDPYGGDYLVRYQPDGYLSWSPKQAFEDGYTLIED